MMQTLEFQAETQQLLQLMVHSVYSQADVFLRELISNASDALDRLRLESCTKNVDADDLHIMLELDPDARTLSVVDNGIGMTRDDVVALIGTIAKSGTAEFLSLLKEGKPGLIGRFGIGFYSSFMAASRVTLVTRRAGEATGTRWTSDGTATYTIEAVDDAPQGTRVTLHLKNGDYASELKIREIVKKYSDFITWPIRMRSEMVDEIVTLNSMQAIWARPRDTVSREEYDEFYKHLTHDWNDPLHVVHFRAEGRFEFEALLYVPSHAPHDLFARDGRHGIQLYVRRVFVMEECRGLLPGYLRWMRGVVDAHDLSMNLSREMAQQDQQMQIIRRHLVRKILNGLRELFVEDRGKYVQFWQQCGQKFKEGLKKHPEDREVLLELSMFESTRSAELTTLREYVERMPEDQPAIFYMNAQSRAEAEGAPHLEALTRRGWEVLLLTHPVDELWVVDLKEYEGRKVQSAARSGIALDAPTETGWEPLLAWMKAVLAEDVKDVRLSQRLESSLACIVGDARDVSPQLEKMARATGQTLPRVKRVLEINPRHEVAKKLRDAHEQCPDESLQQTTELIHAVAVLTEGGTLPDPRRTGKTLADALSRLL